MTERDWGIGNDPEADAQYLRDIADINRMEGRPNFGVAPSPPAPADHASDYGTPVRHKGARIDCKFCPPVARPEAPDASNGSGDE